MFLKISPAISLSLGGGGKRLVDILQDARLNEIFLAIFPGYFEFRLD
jgi:hypothetical protein